MWSSPLKEKKPTKAEVEAKEKPLKKKKCPIKVGTAKAICDPEVKRDVGRDVCEWCERWIEQLVRERSFPPQMVSDDFLPMLSKLLPNDEALAILSQLRADFKRHFPRKESEDDLAWLTGIVEIDTVAKEWLRELKE
jgi:hypothetical protein